MSLDTDLGKEGVGCNQVSVPMCSVGLTACMNGLHESTVWAKKNQPNPPFSLPSSVFVLWLIGGAISLDSVLSEYLLTANDLIWMPYMKLYIWCIIIKKDMRAFIPVGAFIPAIRVPFPGCIDMLDVNTFFIRAHSCLTHTPYLMYTFLGAVVLAGVGILGWIMRHSFYSVSLMTFPCQVKYPSNTKSMWNTKHTSSYTFRHDRRSLLFLIWLTT